MPAPPSGLLTALRDPQVGVARHLFFSLAHSQGTIYAWDGIGEYVLGGNTYTGIGDLASIAGVSQSRELQTHQVSVVLQGVTLTALRDTDQDIRGDAAVIQAVWFDSAGNTYGPKTLFSGYGDNVSITVDTDLCTITARLRGPMANWARPPASYYTPSDQAREFVGDTGLDYIPGLSNALANGWSISAEASGGRPQYYVTTGDYRILIDDVTQEIIGHDAYGLTLSYDDVPSATSYYSTQNTAGKASAAFDPFEEDGTSAGLERVANGSVVTVGGVECYVDEFGDVRTAGGNLVVAGSTGSGYQLRRMTAISAVGTAGSNGIQRSSIPSTMGYPLQAPSAFVNWCWEVTNQPSGNDFSGMVFCNRYGVATTVQDFGGTGWEVARYNPDTASYQHYVEQDTGNEVYFNGSNVLVTAAGACTISSTGAVRTADGKFVVADGGPTSAFLRVWT